MAKAIVDLSESDTEMGSDVRVPETISPYSVLGVPRNASVEEARDAAERMIMQMVGRGGYQEWIMNMKLAAFGAIADEKLGEVVAFQLYFELHQKLPPVNMHGIRLNERGLAVPPPAPPDGPRGITYVGATPKRPPQPRNSGRSSGSAATSAARGSVGSELSIKPYKQEGASEGKDEVYWWQVKKGQTGKRKWGWVDDHVNDRLEKAFKDGVTEITAEIDGWQYVYNFESMTQTSPGEGATKRQIRRVICDGDSDEGWTLRREARG